MFTSAHFHTAAVALTAVAVTALTPAAARAEGKAQYFKVGAAGFTLVVQEVPESGTVAISGSLNAGGRFDPAGKRGVADITASMLDKGTTARSKLAVAQTLETIGSTIGFGSTWAYTNFTANAVASQLPVTLDLLAESLKTPAFDVAELDKLKKLEKAEILQEEDRTELRVQNAMMRKLYPPGHPRYIPVVEERVKALDAITVEDLKAFHKAHYGSASMIVSVVGHVKAEDVKAQFEKHFGPWAGGKAERPVITGTLQAPESSETIQVPGKINCTYFMTLPLDFKFGDADYWPSVIGNANLGGFTLTSRLGSKIRGELGLTYGINSRNGDLTYGPGFWYVQASALGKNIPAVEENTRKIIADFAAGGITPKELKTEQDYLTGIFIVGLESNERIAETLLWIEQSGAGRDYIEKYGPTLKAVTKAQVDATAKKVFGSFAKAQTVIAGDRCKP